MEEGRQKPQPGEPGRGGKEMKISPVAKTFRATTAVVVFGVPLAVGAATLLCYGAAKVLRRLTSRS
jgi:TPP-dependent pyruvate/acetoin dehydrogenase alpha subunit